MLTILTHETSGKIEPVATTRPPPFPLDSEQGRSRKSKGGDVVRRVRILSGETETPCARSTLFASHIDPVLGG